MYDTNLDYTVMRALHIKTSPSDCDDRRVLTHNCIGLHSQRTDRQGLGEVRCQTGMLVSESWQRPL